MLEIRLFLGVEVDETLQKFLDGIKPRMKDLFINSDDAYLSTVTCENVTYLGKYLGNIQTVLNLETVQLNIHSILKRMNTSFRPLPHPAKLIAVLT